MSATKSLARVLEEYPNFSPGWTAFVNGEPQPPDTIVSLRHPNFGSVEQAVVMKADGTPSFDRPLYIEAPFGQTVLYGYGKDGKTRLGLVVQERPHADVPGNENYDRYNRAVLFMTCVMGFKDKIRGKLEEDLATARREMKEEMGTAMILSEWEHQTGHNPSPSFTSTWGAVTALQIDLSSLVEAGHDPNEPLAGRFWLTVREWKDAVARGYFTFANGRVAYTCYDVSVGAVQMFLSAHPAIEREAFE